MRIRTATLIRIVRHGVRVLSARGRWHGRGYDLSIALLRPTHVNRLKRRLLNRRDPASVLSFDYGTSGELVLSPVIIRRQALRAGQNNIDQALADVIAHGLVHVSGVHHERGTRERERFSALEERIRRGRPAGIRR